MIAALPPEGTVVVDDLDPDCLSVGWRTCKHKRVVLAGPFTTCARCGISLPLSWALALDPIDPQKFLETIQQLVSDDSDTESE